MKGLLVMVAVGMLWGCAVEKKSEAKFTSEDERERLTLNQLSGKYYVGGRRGYTRRN